MNSIDPEPGAPAWFNQTPGTIYHDTGAPGKDQSSGMYSGVVCGKCGEARVEISGTTFELVEQIILRRWRNLENGWMCPDCVEDTVLHDYLTDSTPDILEVFRCETCEKEKGRADAWSCHHQEGERWRANQAEENTTLPTWDWGDESGKTIHLRVFDTEKGRVIKWFGDDGLTMSGHVVRVMAMWMIHQMEDEANTRPDRENDLLVAVIRSAVSDGWNIYAKNGKVYASTVRGVSAGSSPAGEPYGSHHVYREFVLGNEPLGDFVTRLNKYRP